MRRRAIHIVAIGLALTAAFGAWFITSRGPWATDADSPSPPGSQVARLVDGRSPPILGVAPDFALTDQSGEGIGPGWLRGKVWVANFIFTRCTTTCPRQTARMAKLAEGLRGDLADDVRLVSFSVDPGHDTPEVLRAYAETVRADGRIWSFLTGPREEIRRVGGSGFKLPIEDDAGALGGPIIHSPTFVLVDPVGRIRGYFDGLSPEGFADLERDLKAVLAERVFLPDDVGAPSWLESRRQFQMEAGADYGVFHQFRFTDRVRESGIRFRHEFVDDSGRGHMPVHYDHGNGVAIADVDGDGLPDIYFVNQAGANQLWRNLGGGRFEDVTRASGTEAAGGVGVSASFADVDNDGDPDLYVTKVRTGNLLFENDGRGKFADISRASGLDYRGHSSAAVFFDYDHDGWLDLFLVNVGKFTTDTLAVNSQMGAPAGKPPFRYYLGLQDAFAGHLKPERSERSLLFRNVGGRRFVDVSQKTGLDHAGWSGDASPLDANGDGWPDLYVLSMQGEDAYYENVGGVSFVDKSRELFPKTPWGSMGVKVFDHNNDGRFDVFVTDMHSDMSAVVDPDQEWRKSRILWTDEFLKTDGRSLFGNAFFEGGGGGTFEEVSDRLGVENYWPWGVSVGDLNADGFEDMFITSSMNYPYRYGINSLLLNDHGEKFLGSEFLLGAEPRRDGRTAVPWFERDCGTAPADEPPPECEGRDGRTLVWGALGSRSSAIVDLDDDGDLDIVTNDFGSEPMVLISDLERTKPDLHYLKISLVGNASNRDGLGATVTVTADSRSFHRTHDGKSGYLSQSVYPLYFGLGESQVVDRVEVRWPSGRIQVVAGPIKTNSILKVQEP